MDSPPPRLEVEYRGHIPSKSNDYRLGRRGKTTRGNFHVDTKVKKFERDLADKFVAAVGRPITWSIPANRLREFLKGKTKNPKTRPEDPPYPKGVQVDVVVIHYRAPLKGRARHPDVDDMLKAIGDAITQSGVWWDDNQVRWWIAGHEDVPDDPYLYVAVIPTRGGADRALSWLELPSPLSRREWVKQQKAEESLGLPDPEPSAYCDRCCAAIGKHCVEQEAYVLPIKKASGHYDFQVICGTCADEYHDDEGIVGLSHRYRAISRAQMQSLRKYQAIRVISTKVKELRDASTHQR